MKIVYALLFLCLAATGVHAATTAGGFNGPDSRPLVTTQELDSLPDDTGIRLVGYIVRKTGDENYEFKDDLGTVVVEIDDDVWQGLEISPADKVELIAEVDKEWSGLEVEVDSIRRMP